MGGGTDGNGSNLLELGIYVPVAQAQGGPGPDGVQALAKWALIRGPSGPYFTLCGAQKGRIGALVAS